MWQAEKTNVHSDVEEQLLEDSPGNRYERCNLRAVVLWKKLCFRFLQYNSLRHEVLMTHVNLLFTIFFFKKRMTRKWTSLLLGVTTEPYYIELLLIMKKNVRTLQRQGCDHSHPLCNRGEKNTPFLQVLQSTSSYSCWEPGLVRYQDQWQKGQAPLCRS